MEHETSQMNTYAVECSCGHDLKVQAEDKDEAICTAYKGVGEFDSGHGESFW
jgi:hypothetical protein